MVSLRLWAPQRERGHSSGAAVQDPVPAKPQASAVVLDMEARAEPDGCAAHTKLLRVTGSSVPPVGAPPMSVLFCACKFSVAKKRPENQNPRATGSCLWFPPQTVVRAFAFTQRSPEGPRHLHTDKERQKSAGAAWGLLGGPLKASVWAAHPKGCSNRQSPGTRTERACGPRGACSAPGAPGHRLEPGPGLR